MINRLLFADDLFLLACSQQHRCRSRQMSGGTKDFYPNFPKLARKVFVRFSFCHEDHEDLLLCDLQNNGVHVFFCKCWALFFEVKQRWAPFLSIFSRNFAQIFRIFSRFSAYFQGYFPDFRQIKTFGGCVCTPAPPPPAPLLIEPSTCTRSFFCNLHPHRNENQH